MEISILEEEAKVEIIKGHKNLKYKVKNNGKNINFVPRYINWLNSMKAERGENGIITYCTKCKAFLYLDNVQQKHSLNHVCCDHAYCADFCEYCGELYNEYSICCLRKCFDIFKYLSYNIYFAQFCLCLLFIPILSLAWAFYCCLIIIFSKRIKKSDDILYHDDGIFESKFNYIFEKISILMLVVYPLLYFIPYFFTIYFFQLFAMIKVRSQKISDEANNIMRY